METNTKETVNHPNHYTSHPTGIECIQITEHFNFNIGNSIKYLWRAGLKNSALEDLEKAAWYITREIKKLKESTKEGQNVKATGTMSGSKYNSTTAQHVHTASYQM